MALGNKQEAMKAPLKVEEDKNPIYETELPTGEEVVESPTTRARIKQAIEYGWADLAGSRYRRYGRVAQQYEAGCSTLTPEEINAGKLMEEKIVFTWVKKVFEKLRIPRNKIVISANRDDIEDAVLEFVKDKFDKSKTLKQQLTKEFKRISQAQQIEIGEDMNETALDIIDSEIGIERFVSFLIEKALVQQYREAGLYNSYRGRNGIHFKLSLFGTAPLLVTADNASDFPTKYQTIPNDKIFLDPTATAIEGAPDGSNARYIVIVFDYDDYDVFYNQLNANERLLADGIQWGNLPYEKGDKKNITVNDKRPGQMALLIDIDRKIIAKAAGQNLAIISEKQYDGEFPYVVAGKPALPAVLFGCFPNPNSIWDFGVGDYGSQINNIMSIVRSNRVLKSINDSMPIQLITGSEEIEDDFDWKMQRAEGMRQQRRMPYIFNPTDANGKAGLSDVKALNTFNDGSANAYNSINEMRFDLEQMMGINTADVSTEASKTATAIESEAAAQASIIDFIEEYNTRNYKLVGEFTIDNLRRFGDKDSDTPVPMDEINQSDKLLRILAGRCTIGDIVKLLDKVSVIVEMDKTFALEPQKLRFANSFIGILSGLPAGSPIQTAVTRKIVSHLGMEITNSDLMTAAAANAAVTGSTDALNQQGEQATGQSEVTGMA